MEYAYELKYIGEGSVEFFDGHKDMIINLDETDGALNNEFGKRGGRPSFVFYSEEHREQIRLPINQKS